MANPFFIAVVRLMTALTKSFRHTSRFQRGRMEDAEETLEAILEAFHHSHCQVTDVD